MISDRRVDKHLCPFNTFFIGIFKGLKLLSTEKQKEREAFLSFNFKRFSSDTEILTLNNKQVIKYQTSVGMAANKEEYKNQTAERLPLGLLLAEPTLSHYILGPL